MDTRDVLNLKYREIKPFSEDGVAELILNDMNNILSLYLQTNAPEIQKLYNNTNKDKIIRAIVIERPGHRHEVWSGSDEHILILKLENIAVFELSVIFKSIQHLKDFCNKYNLKKLPLIFCETKYSIPCINK